MKVALFLIAIFAIFATVNCLPATGEPEQATSTQNWLDRFAYPYLMCRMKCRQNCMEQGFWAGVCKQEGTCLCYGPMDKPLGRFSEYSMPLF